MNRTHSRCLATLAGSLLLLPFAACSQAPVVAVRLQVKPDFSGQVTTSCLQRPDAPGPTEGASEGAVWAERAALSCAQGTFAALSNLKIADVSFHGAQTNGINYVRVTLPRGAEARWPAVMLPAPDDRGRVEKTFDPRDELGQPASRITIEIDLPEAPVSHGVRPSARGVVSTLSGRRLSLSVPIHQTKEGAPLVWHMTW